MQVFRNLKGIGLFVLAFTFANLSFASDGKTEEKGEMEELIKSLDDYYQEMITESFGLSSEPKVMIYNPKGDLIIDKPESELSPEDYRILFQSDFIMESGEKQFYILD